MFLRSISLNHFRNYTSQEVSFGKGINIFVGRNAQGKTNLLEAVYFLSTGRSFRTVRVGELIEKGSKYLHAACVAESRDTSFRLRIYYSEKSKTAKINARKVRRFHEIVGLLNVVVFAPDDINIIKGPPVNRRRFLDIQIAQVNRTYLKRLHRYNEVVKQRNAALKAGDRAHIDVWNEELVRHGVTIACERKETIRKLNLLARLAHRKMAQGKEELQIEYATSIGGGSAGEIEDSFRKQLRVRSVEELRIGSTMVGPHRDEVVFKVNGLNARIYASEGQRRSIAMALRLAQYELLKSGSREKPVVLIDDVTAELDPVRKKAFMPLLDEKGQIFVATVSDEKVYKEWSDARLFTVENGAVFC